MVYAPQAHSWYGTFADFAMTKPKDFIKLSYNIIEWTERLVDVPDWVYDVCDLTKASKELRGFEGAFNGLRIVSDIKNVWESNFALDDLGTLTCDACKAAKALIKWNVCDLTVIAPYLGTAISIGGVVALSPVLKKNISELFSRIWNGPREGESQLYNKMRSNELAIKILKNGALFAMAFASTLEIALAYFAIGALVGPAFFLYCSTTSAVMAVVAHFLSVTVQDIRAAERYQQFIA